MKVWSETTLTAAGTRQQSSGVFETIRNWADEFQDYLSPTATPGRGKHRMYTLTTLVFALWPS